ncbi:hypothetical protein WOC76_05025 [Methylocystis sp. IM3]|uniref:hypothetical protein n=2 Tax=Methylocystis TaxID=133 RepID=UPI00311A7658
MHTRDADELRHTLQSLLSHITIGGAVVIGSGAECMANLTAKLANLAQAAVVAFSVPVVSPASAQLFRGPRLAQQATPDQFVTSVRYRPARHFVRRVLPAEQSSEAPEPGGATGEALAACEKGIGKSEDLSLPGTKGEIKLDRCYRGREQLVCSLAALSLQAKALVQDFSKIIEANYPDVANVDSICRMAPENLAAHMQKASTFSTRFRDLKNEYDRRLACVEKVEQSLQQVSLADMPRSDEILKSVNETLQGDIKDVAATRQVLLDLAERMDSSQKAIAVIQKLYRTMCFAQTPEQPISAAVQEKPPIMQPAAPAPQFTPTKKEEVEQPPLNRGLPDGHIKTNP